VEVTDPPAIAGGGEKIEDVGEGNEERSYSGAISGILVARPEMS